MNSAATVTAPRDKIDTTSAAKGVQQKIALPGNDRAKIIPVCGDPASGGCALWRRVYTMEEAAGICSVHRTTLTRRATVGDLITCMIGERRLVDEQQLAHFIERSSASRLLVAPADVSGDDDTVSFLAGRICAKKEGQICICPKALTVIEAAAAIRIHPTSVAKFVSSGELKSAKIGAARRIFSFDLWVFFENRAVGKNASSQQEAS
jgi:hypothetical protein